MPVMPFLPWSDPLVAATPVPSPMSAAQWGVLCAGALLIIYILLRSNRKRKADPLEKSPVRTSLAQQRSVERQMQTLLVELSEMARQVTAQLDTRSTKLALMIDDADEKAARLQRLLDECRATLDAARAPAPTTAPGPTPDPTPALAESTPKAEPPAFEPSLALPDESDARHQQVYAMADQGRSPSDIARQIDRPRGEIDLILALRPR
jgi:hypothetical protein